MAKSGIFLRSLGLLLWNRTSEDCGAFIKPFKFIFYFGRNRFFFLCLGWVIAVFQQMLFDSLFFFVPQTPASFGRVQSQIRYLTIMFYVEICCLPTNKIYESDLASPMAFVSSLFIVPDFQVCKICEKLEQLVSLYLCLFTFYWDWWSYHVNLFFMCLSFSKNKIWPRTMQQ